MIAWDPPGRVESTWHPGGCRDDRQTVNVEFRAESDGTHVTLTHRGWQRAGVASCSLQAGPAPPWQALLQGRYAVFAAEQMLVAV